MLIRLQPRRDERAALAFEDVASAIDAGLPPPMLGGDPAAGDRILPGLFARRQIDLDPGEVLVLIAAWRAGRGPDALRHLARQRRQRAEFARPLLASLRYPTALVAVAMLVSFFVRSLPGLHSLPYWITACVVLGALGLGFGLRALAQGSAWLRNIPLAGEVAASLAELPYLEVMRGLYSAGVPLREAHPQAMATCSVPAVRNLLQQADVILQQGRPLAEALDQARALHPETLHLLATGERAGTLEDALHRALVRRQAVASQSAAQLSRVLGVACYTFGLLVSVYVIVSVYAGYGAMLRSAMR